MAAKSTSDSGTFPLFCDADMTTNSTNFLHCGAYRVVLQPFFCTFKATSSFSILLLVQNPTQQMIPRSLLSYKA